MKLWPLQPRQPFVGLALAAVAGIVAADWWSVPLVAVFAASAFLLALVVVLPRTWSCLLFTSAAFFTLHTVWHHHGAARLLARELDGGSRVVRATGIVWSEPEAPQVWSRTISARFHLKLQAIDLGNGELPADSLVNVSWSGQMPAYGDRVRITAAAQNIPPLHNPGQFDTPGYLQRLGIYSELRARYPADCIVVAHDCGNPAQAFAIKARHWITTQLTRDLEDEPHLSALIASMVLGMKGDTPDEMKTMFQRTGTMHLFAVSGLNVAMLGAIAWFLLKFLRVPRAPAIFIIVPLLCAYALVTGLNPSCVRATLMGSLMLLAFLCDRRGVVYNSLGAAAFLIVAWDTEQVFSPGFQFSFVLVAVIVWLSGKIQRRIEPLAAPDPFIPRPLWGWHRRLGTLLWSGFAAALGVSISAWLGSLLFTVGYFHLFSASTVFANFFAVPTAYAVLALGLASLLSATFSSGLVVTFNNANWLCAKFLLGTIASFSRVPGGHVYLETRLGHVPAMEITVLDLAAGGATHLRAGGRDWLIDCGADYRYGQTVLPYLRSRGVNRLDGLVLTHGDVQHIGAAPVALEDFRPRKIIDSPLADRSQSHRAIDAEISARGLSKTLCQRGDILEIAPGATIRVLFPPADLHRALADDRALVLLVECAGERVLFMSDSGFATEQWLLKSEPDLRADLLVKGQHERDFSGTLDFLAAVQPQAIVCGSPGFGETTAALAEWEKKLSERGVALFRQDRVGAVCAKIESGAFEVRTFLGGQTFRSRAR